MSDVKPEGAGGREAVEALIAEARETGPFEHYEPVEDVHWWRNLANRLADALEAAQQAPAELAVDREALRQALMHIPGHIWDAVEEIGDYAGFVEALVDSGVLRDIAEERAKALEEFGAMVDASPAVLWAGKGGVKEMLAQAIREGRA